MTRRGTTTTKYSSSALTRTLTLPRDQLRLSLLSRSRRSSRFLGLKADTSNKFGVYVLINKRYLVEQDFIKAIKCIAIIQENDSLDDLAINLKEVLPLPKFNHPKIEKFLKKAEEKVLDSSPELDLQVEEEIKIDESFYQNTPLDVEEAKVDYSKKSTKMSGFKSKPAKQEEHKVSEGLNVSIPKFETISQGFMGINSYTQFMIVTIPHNIPMLETGQEYRVWRRFSDFEWLHNSILSQDEYKGHVLPPLPEKSYLSRHDDTFLDARRLDLQTYLKSLAEHKVIKNSRTFHLFLTTMDEEEFNNLKSQESTLQARLFEYAQMIRNFDVDHLVTNIGQYFDSHEPEKFALAAPIKSHVEAILDYEKRLDTIVK